MPGAHYLVFKNLRPPVAIDEDDKSPLRIKRASKVFNMSS